MTHWLILSEITYRYLTKQISRMTMDRQNSSRGESVTSDLLLASLLTLLVGSWQGVLEVTVTELWLSIAVLQQPQFCEYNWFEHPWNIPRSNGVCISFTFFKLADSIILIHWRLQIDRRILLIYKYFELLNNAFLITMFLSLLYISIFSRSCRKLWWSIKKWS